MTKHSLKPLNDLQVVGDKDGFINYRNVGNDPYFDVNLPIQLIKGWYEIVIPIEKISGSIKDPIFYFDSGEGYNEIDTIRIPLTNKNVIGGVVAFPALVKALRFDPTNVNSEFAIKDIQITKLSRVDAGVKLYKLLKNKVKGSILIYLLKVFLRSGISGVRKEIRDAPFYNSVKDDNLLYEEWIEDQEKFLSQEAIDFKKNSLKYTPLISIILPTYNTPLDWLEECIASVCNQSYSNWELCIADDASTAYNFKKSLAEYEARDSRIKIVFREKNGHISSCSNSALKIAKGEWVALLDHDDKLTNNALLEIVIFLQDKKEVDVIYTDQDKISKEGKYYQPFFKPDWSPVFLKGVMNIGHLLVVRRSIGEKVGWFDSNFDKIQDYEFMLRVSEVTDKVLHIPKILYHWRESENSIASSSNAKGGVEALQEIAVTNHLKRLGINGYAKQNKFSHQMSLLPNKKEKYPKISIIIPTKNCASLLKQCIESILLLTQYPNYEIILIDTGSDESDAIELIDLYSKNPIIKLLYYKEKFNFSKVNNYGVTKASGTYYLFLNNDTEILTEDWLENMLFFNDFPNVGAVGSLLLFPNGTVQHAGVLLGFRGTADHIMRSYPSDCDGYFGSLSCAREVSAVTAACMLVKKEVFVNVGGFEESYNSVYQDVDLCLKIRNKGFTIICTPTVRLYHHESVSRGGGYDYMDRMLLKDQWEEELLADPYYNSNFRLDIYGNNNTGYEPKYKQN